MVTEITSHSITSILLAHYTILRICSANIFFEKIQGFIVAPGVGSFQKPSHEHIIHKLSTHTDLLLMRHRKSIHKLRKILEKELIVK